MTLRARSQAAESPLRGVRSPARFVDVFGLVVPSVISFFSGILKRSLILMRNNGHTPWAFFPTHTNIVFIWPRASRCPLVDGRLRRRGL